MAIQFIPKLVFEGEDIQTPPGLTELLANAWSHSDEIHIDPIVDKYEERNEKVNGVLRTIFTLKKSK